MFGATVSLPLILSPALCVNDPVDTGKLISTIFFVSGMATLLQTCLGNRRVYLAFNSVIHSTSGYVIILNLYSSDYQLFKEVLFLILCQHSPS